MIDRIRVVDVELSAPLQSLGDMDSYKGLTALVRLHGSPIGYVDLPLLGNSFTATDLRRLALRRLAVPLITIAVCTRDRTEDLKTCLDALVRLEYPHLDILVVDNAPGDDATERLVEQYSHVRYVREPEPGLSRARNRAIAEARGEIVAFTDDDVVVDPGWASGLSRAFEDPEVMGVTGLIVPGTTLPLELETVPQRHFERYGVLGCGFAPKEAGGEWFDSFRYRAVPTWELETTANAAFRAGIFAHPEIGLKEEALGVGTPTGCSQSRLHDGVRTVGLRMA